MQCVFIKNWPFQARSIFADMDSSETLFYSFIVSINKCGGNCNTIDAPYARVCISNDLKNMNLKISNFM